MISLVGLFDQFKLHSLGLKLFWLAQIQVEMCRQLLLLLYQHVYPIPVRSLHKPAFNLNPYHSLIIVTIWGYFLWHLKISNLLCCWAQIYVVLKCVEMIRTLPISYERYGFSVWVRHCRRRRSSAKLNRQAVIRTTCRTIKWTGHAY